MNKQYGKEEENMYGFFLNMWIMGRIGKDYLDIQESVGRIDKEEKDMITATPQLTDYI